MEVPSVSFINYHLHSRHRCRWRDGPRKNCSYESTHPTIGKVQRHHTTENPEESAQITEQQRGRRIQGSIQFVTSASWSISCTAAVYLCVDAKGVLSKHSSDSRGLQRLPWPKRFKMKLPVPENHDPDSERCPGWSELPVRAIQLELGEAVVGFTQARNRANSPLPGNFQRHVSLLSATTSYNPENSTTKLQRFWPRSENISCLRPWIHICHTFLKTKEGLLLRRSAYMRRQS